MFSAVIEDISRFLAKGVAKWRHPSLGALMLLASFGISSCAVSPVGDGSKAPETADAKREAVKQRVNARWDALIKGDFDAAYALLSPASRETVTLEYFKSHTRRDSFRKAEIKSVECGADTCNVKLWITYDHPRMQGVETPMEETWVFDKGQAWLVYRG
jgi:hypothetical protein